ncbi:MAG: hypothetical protein ACLRSW_05680 [Christensenellaceae bacterium]
MRRREKNGFEAIVCAAGKAAHLGASSPLPRRCPSSGCPSKRI